MTEIFYFGCDFLYTAVRGWATWRLMEVVASPRRNKKRQDLIWMVMILLLSMLSTYNDSVIKSLFSNGLLIVIVLILSLVSCVTFDSRFWNSFCMVFLLWTGLALADLFFQTITYTILTDIGMTADIFLTRTLYRSIYLLLCSVLLCLTVWFVRRRIKDYDVSRYLKWAWLFVPPLFLCMAYFQRIYKLHISEQMIQRWWLFLRGSLLAALILGGYAIMQRERENGRLLKLKTDMLENEYRDLLNAYEEKEILRHDFKNHMAVIREMAEEGRNQEILCYLDELNSALQKGRNRNLANHDLINLILNRKFCEAEAAGISLRYEMEDMSGLLLKPIEICALFSNMLDNAIEANRRIAEDKECWIELTCTRKGQMLLFCISNPMAETGMRFSEGLPETIKQDKREHGFGMRSIRQVVNTHEGYIQIETRDGIYGLTVCLKGF